MQKKSFLILGAGRLGSTLALTLSKLGAEVCVVDKDRGAVEEISDFITHSLIADCMEKSVMSRLGIADYDVVIVALSEDMLAGILTTVHLKEEGAKYIISRAADEVHAKILSKVGADEVIMPESEMGERLANKLMSNKFLEYIELSDKYSIAEIACPAKWISKSIMELDIRNNYKVNVIAVERDDEIEIIHDPSYKAKSGDIFVILGSNEAIKVLQELK